MTEGNRKLVSQKWTIYAVLLIVIAYLVICAIAKIAPDSNIILAAVIAVGGDAVVMKLSNAIGDHGALKKGSPPSA